MDLSVRAPALKSTAPHAIYAVVRGRILDGTYEPGRRLTEQAFADEFASSRTPVREAMRMLAAEGYIDTRPNSGTVVRSWTTEQILEIFNLRASLEADVCGHAALRIAPAQIAELERIQGEIELNGLDSGVENATRVGGLNRRFHDIIAAASGQERTVALLAKAIEVPIVHRTFRSYDAVQMQRSFYQHRELIDAFKAHDREWAVSVMRSHIHAAKNTILQSLHRAESK
ncbi:MAG TPA: GntR family transcriptional regulator [Ramlibacter sp.]|uniref:GntR family transcriptional regulator n=1 Tax=Ramlibacter sp. TaxID=1917967 RepID=UPI002D80C7EF|nr:GntR family transcriptional regulator [Ramlibacter sp.]HET8746823.1 GntR family transcriptional regulator [Ramlibacter sp.]